MQEQVDHLKKKHLRELVAWAKDNPFHKKKLFLVESLSPLILGIKPSVLLNVSLENEIDWQRFKKLLTQQKTIHIQKIRDLNGRAQLIFYHSETLDLVLQQKQIQEFLRTLSYP